MVEGSSTGARATACSSSSRRSALSGWGGWTMLHTPLDAVPDISDVQVIVATEWIGPQPRPRRGPDHVPARDRAALRRRRCKAVRGFTDFGISYVYVIFEDGTDIYWARSRSSSTCRARGQLPEGDEPDDRARRHGRRLGLPVRAGRRHRAAHARGLRSFQDWYLRYWLASVPGVAEVATHRRIREAVPGQRRSGAAARLQPRRPRTSSGHQASNNDVEGRLLEFAGASTWCAAAAT